ncbi:response regulator [Rhodoligotrophos defluvii]|uniref:response regulator n=1 Tax=Rhodoligotrophos defluvii TaxID=2561934 RepID=UPI0010C9C1AE|nr:response regulator [Rhodoligotrophos defluvii]
MTTAEEKSTILILDDEAEILTALEDLFEDAYHVLSTTSAEHALELLARVPDVAVIISDQRMPDLTGDQFLARARALSDAQAVLLTGYADINAVIAAINTGRVSGYVHKPWDPEMLRAMVANARERFLLGRELALERALLAGLLDNSGIAVSFKDRDGRFVRVNEFKARKLGAAPDTCIGRLEQDFVEPARAKELAELEAYVIERKRARETIEERPQPEGPSRWYSVSRFPILDHAGNVTHIGTIQRDITEQRQMEERLRQADKMQALGTLAGGVAHDFNNLLMAMLGNLELAAKRVPDERVGRYLRNAIAAGKRGAALTERLLSFSRRKDMRVSSLDLNDLIRNMDNMLERTLGGLIEIEAQLAPDLWPTRADPEQIELAILNLCINARDAMPDGGTIVIRTANEVVVEAAPDLKPGAYIRLAVSDAGVGMSAEVQRRALEPFFTTKAGKGTGLGLSMVYGMAMQLGGAVRIVSREGQGTTVDLYLPSGGPAQRRVLPEAAEVRAPRIDPVRVLLVDDDDDVREVTAAHLAELGHALVSARDGAAALDIIAGGGSFDLMIADFAMPGMTGLELALRARKFCPDLPVLLVTGHADVAETPENMRLLVKPFQQDELGLHIAELLNKG